MKFSKFREEFKLLKVFYTSSFITEVGGAFLASLWVIYFLGIGLSPVQISLLIVATTTSMIIFEVPTGAFADIFGRKKSVVLSFMMTGILSILLPFTQSFLVLFVLHFLMGFAQTFESGAGNAWFIDYVKHNKKEKILQRVLARNHSLSLIGAAIGGIIASVILIFTFGLVSSIEIIRYLWILSGLIFLLVAFIYSLGKEPYFRSKKINIKQDILKSFKLSSKGFKHTMSHRTILLLISASSLFFLASAIISIGWQQFLKFELGINEMYLGFVVAGFSIISAFTMGFVESFSKKMKHEKFALMVIGIALSISMFIQALTNSPVLAFLAFGFYFVFFDFRMPIHTHFFNKFVSSKMRATLGSVESMFISIATLIGSFFGYGLITEFFGIKTAYLVCAVITLISVLIYLAIKE